MHGEKLSVRNLGGLNILRCGITGAGIEGSNRTDAAYDAEKSDNVILPKKQANKGASRPAEFVEGRTLTKGNPYQPATAWTQSQPPVSPGLMRVRHAARTGKTGPFAALLHHVTPELLATSYRALKRNAAAGIDGCTWESYGETP